MSFGGSFLTEPPKNPFIPERFAPEERQMGEAAMRFARQEALPALESGGHSKMRELLEKAAHLGLLGVDVPAEYGGLALSKPASALIAESLAIEPSFSVSQGVHTSVASFPLMIFGTADQQARYLPRLAAGELIGAYALTEAEAGSDALAGRTRAESDGKGGYRLTGGKMWITNAHMADLFIVFAKAEGDRFTAFLVHGDSPGLSIGQQENKLGLRGSSTARIVLESVPVAPDDMLGKVGQGAQVALFTLNLGRFKIAAAATGLAKEALRLATEYAAERKQFGQAIGGFPMIRQKLAAMRVLIFAAESSVYRLAGDLEAVFQANKDDLAKAAAEFAAECALVKVLATEMLQFVVDEALQIHGGYGFSEEFPIARIYRDIRVSRIYEGTNEINRLNLIEMLKKRCGASLTARPTDDPLRALVKKGLNDYKDQRTAQPLADALIGLYAMESAQARCAITGKPDHAAMANWYSLRVFRGLPGWRADIDDLESSTTADAILDSTGGA